MENAEAKYEDHLSFFGKIFKHCHLSLNAESCALKTTGLVMIIKQCTSPNTCRTTAKAPKVPALACCFSQVLWRLRSHKQNVETFKSVLGLVLFLVLLGQTCRFLPSFCREGLDLQQHGKTIMWTCPSWITHYGKCI